MTLKLKDVETCPYVVLPMGRLVSEQDFKDGLATGKYQVKTLHLTDSAGNPVSVEEYIDQDGRCVKAACLS